MGDVGTGKTHMASALCQLACDSRLEARFFTASSLVMRLRRAREEGRLDREMSQIARARLLVIDELGFLPLDADGARLIFQVFADAYERQSVVITTNLEFSRWGGSSGTTRWPPPSSTASCTTAGSSNSAASRIAWGTRSCRTGRRSKSLCSNRLRTLLNSRCAFCSKPLD